VLTVSFSELEAYRQCPFKWALEYRDRWQPPTKPPALARGIRWHEIMATHYRGIQQAQNGGDVDTDQTIAGMRALLEIDDNDSELLCWMYEGYLERYGAELDWTVLAVEHTAIVPLCDDIALKMRVDLVVRDTFNKVWLVDHKTGKDLPNEVMLDLDPQFGLYTWGLRQLGQEVWGQVCNAVRTYRHKTPIPVAERYGRYRLYRTDLELERLARDYTETARRLAAEIDDPPKHIQSGANSHCRYRCDYTEPCLAHSKGTDIGSYLRSAGYTQGYDER